MGKGEKGDGERPKGTLVPLRHPSIPRQRYMHGRHELLPGCEVTGQGEPELRQLLSRHTRKVDNHLGASQNAWTELTGVRQ
jgi:hypothetical protein